MKRALVVVAGLAVAGLIAYFVTRGSGGDSPSEGTTAAKPTDARKRVAATALPKPARISGRVTTAIDGAPIASAVVHLVATEGGSASAGATELTARTSPDGAWTIRAVPPGEYRVSATASGFLPALVNGIPLGDGASRNGVDLALEAGGHRLAGVVTDVTGGPVSGAVVQVTPVHGILSVRADHGYAAMTDSNGRYALHLSDGRYRVTAFHSDYAPYADFVELRGGESALSFSLTPGAVIEGTVVSEHSGEPVPYAGVSYGRETMMAMPGGAMMETRGGSGLVFADAEGAFRIRGLQAGALSLHASAAGHSSLEPTTVSLGIAEQVTGIELFVARGFSVRGKVVIDGNSDEPARSVTVIATQPGAGFGEATEQPTGADGRFVIDGLQPGRYQLQAEGKRFVPTVIPNESITVEDADIEGVTLSVKSGAMISGRVEPASIAEVGIELVSPDGGGRSGLDLGFSSLTMGTVRTKQDGSFELGPVTPGDVALVARSGDGRKGRTRVEVALSGKAGVVISLETRSTLSGVVVDADGQPVDDAVVSLSRRQTGQHMVMIVNGRDALAERSPTHEDGSFVMRGLDSGSYELSVMARGGQRLSWAKPDRKTAADEPMQISIPETSEKKVTLKVEARNGVIEGVVVDPEGSPAADAWVTATPQRGLLGGGMPDLEQVRERASKQSGDGENKHEVRTMVMVVEDDGGGEHGGGDFSGPSGGLGLGSAVPPVLTDENGTFRITGLRSGKYDLTAEGMRGSARGFAPEVETGSERTIELVALTRIDGTVTLGGKPVEQFYVQVNGKSLRSKSVHDRDGAFTIHRVDPGDYTIEVSSTDGKGQAQVTVIAGKAARVEVNLATLAAVTGQVFYKDGNPVAGAMVMLGSGSIGGGLSNVNIMMGDGDEPTTTGPDGKFRVRAAAGQHILMVMDPETHQPLVMRQIQVQPGQDLELGRLDQRSMGGRLRLGGDNE